MDQVESKQITKTEITHKFYCDNCNKFLGSSIEYDDGYYDSYGEYNQEFILHGIGHFYISCCLCDKCKDSYNNDLKSQLITVFRFNCID